MRISQPSIPPANSVGTSQLQDGAVTSPKLDATLAADIAYLDAANVFQMDQEIREAANNLYLYFTNQNAAALEGHWAWVARSGGTMELWLLDDSGNHTGTIFTIKRSGSDPSQLTIASPTIIFSGAAWTITSVTISGTQLDFSGIGTLKFGAQQIDGQYLKDASVTSAKLAGGINLGYGFRFDSTGAAIYLPTGWTVSRTSTGLYVLTHNLGLATPGSVGVVANPNIATGDIYTEITTFAANSLEVNCFNSADATRADCEVIGTLILI